MDMKKKNSKSCVTWLKNIFVSHPINKASLCLTLSESVISTL